MHKLLIALSFLAFSCYQLNAQTSKKRLPQIINVPTYSHIFPSLSGDGNQMIYLTNYTNSEGFETKYAYRTGQNSWAEPVPLPSINKPGLDHIGSFCLSYDGNFVAFASRRSPGIGNYDIWISEKVGDNWSAPRNPGKPINTTSHEGNPSLSPDGKSIYFMRCESMDATKKRNCSIFVSHKLSPTKWSEPEVLPDHINSSHETTPRIMADNKTLIFSSARSGGKGMMDLYSTRLEYDSWSKPKSLNFINTEQNDEFISVPARGDIMYYSGSYKNELNVFMAAIPEQFRSEKVLMMTGTVSLKGSAQKADQAIIQAFDVNTGDVYTTTRPNGHDGSYTLFLPEGTTYDVSAFPQVADFDYRAKMIDLTSMAISRKEDFNMELQTIKNGSIIPLSTIRYEDYTAVLSPESDVELKRIIGFLKKNRNIRIEIGAFIDTVYTDSIPSNDLTEVVMDTVFYELMIDYDSANEVDLTDSSAQVYDDTDIDPDSLLVIVKDSIFQDSSSFHLSAGEQSISQKDSILQKGFILLNKSKLFETYYMVNYTYHNDRTQKQADALKNKLIDLGVPEVMLESKGYGANWEIDRAAEERNYWIELKVIGD